MPNCQVCTSTACSACSLGYFYYNNGVETKCFKYCPSGFTETRNYSIGSLNNQSNYRDQCTPCPSNCSTCNFNICLFCMKGFTYYQGSCVISCPTSMFASQGSCFKCSPNCLTCSDSSTCLNCSAGYGLANKKCNPYCINTVVIASSGIQPCNWTCASNCSTCFGPSFSQCLSCTNGTILQST